MKSSSMAPFISRVLTILVISALVYSFYIEKEMEKDADKLEQKIHTELEEVNQWQP